MRNAIHRRHAGNDRPLAAVLARIARGFLRGAQEHQDRFPGVSRFNLAVAIELSLKAYLLHQGISDDWNRIHIRHDLTKALKCARRAGFPAEPAPMVSLAAVLGPYYETNTILRMRADVIASVDWAKACDTTEDLLNAIDSLIGRRDGDTPCLIGMVTS